MKPNVQWIHQNDADTRTTGLLSWKAVGMEVAGKGRGCVYLRVEELMMWSSPSPLEGR